ncbi:MAG: molybdenum cofactor guanylyltransferase [Solirubrobacteraceae bacterium]
MAEPVGVVLAGGAGRRIGGGKAVVGLEGRPLLDYPLQALRRAVGEVAVVAKHATALPPLGGDVAIWLEADEPRHPLTGVVCALRNAGGRPVIVVAGDMPLVTGELLAALVRAPLRGAPALVPRGGGRLQPLCARYEPAALAALQDFAHDVPTREAVLAIGPAILEWPDEQAFFNVNAPEDLLAAGALLAARR